MHILYFHQHFCPPGAFGNNRSLEMAKYWAEQGHEVTIVCGSGNFKDHLPYISIYKTYTYSGFKVIRLNVGYSHHHSFFRRIFSFLTYLLFTMLLSFKWRKADLIYTSSTPLTVGITGIWLKKILNTPFVFETVDLWPDVPVRMGIIRNSILRNLLFKLEMLIYKEAFHIVCLSEGMKELISAKNIHLSRITVAHNGSNCSVFKPCEYKIPAKKSLKIPEGQFIVLYAGTIGEANGLTFLVDLAEEIKKTSSSPIHFLVLGNGNRKQLVKSYALAKGLQNITFIDPVPKTQVKQYFDAADAGFVCFAPYSILETNSANKFYDYLASGLPVLINYGGWQREYLDKYQAGFSHKHISEMAKELIQLSQNKTMLLKMGQNARQLAEKHFNRNDIAQKILDLFISIKSN